MNKLKENLKFWYETSRLIPILRFYKNKVKAFLNSYKYSNLIIERENNQIIYELNSLIEKKLD